ncbi:MAG TPA: hypothetical protein VHK70_10940 [Burkholderiaceae bacterium]|jgi:hypothetical protein|nr:hypothetical protein [Burkholderiaceae bacterium]
MLKVLFVSLSLCLAAPALAIHKCEAAGKVTYSDAPCPTGTITDLGNMDGGVPATEAERAGRQAAQEKLEADHLAQERHRREASEYKERQAAARRAAAERKKCASLAQRRKWSEEDAARAAGKSLETARRKARHMAEKYELECGKA